MNRFLGAALVLVALALAVACGSGGGEQQPAAGTGAGGDVQEGQAPPAAESIPVDSDGDTIEKAIDVTALATVTVEPTSTAEPSPAGSDLTDQLDELVLAEGDVPFGFSLLGSMDLDYALDFLEMPAPQGVTAYMSIFSTPASQDMIVSMVVLMDDETLLEEAFSEIDNLSIEELEDAFSMVAGYTDMALLDSRELDVSGLGDRAYGLGLTVDVPYAGTMDCEMVFFGEGPVLAMAMTMTMGSGAAPDAVPLAATMADKIEAAVE
jgi:hypothetical protein